MQNFNNTTNAKESTDGHKLWKIEADCDMGFFNAVRLNS